MFFPEVLHGALSPGSHEVVIEHASDRGTRNRNQPSRPFLHHLGAGARGNTLDHFRHEAVHNFFFEQLAADVDSSGAGGGDPKLGDLVVGVELESVDQAELLDGPHGDRRENTEIGNNCQNPAQAKPRTLGCGQLHPAAQNGFGNVIQPRHLNRVNTVERDDRQTIGGAQLKQKALGIDADGFVGAGQSAAKCVFGAAAQPGFFLGLVAVSHR